ncbi:spermidine synthase [Marinomonas pollencensis]|uniref:Spermidine synthase n=1 Tax=Marinomonas pollencensis TaxID=491954 RepID=A0A3E0DQV1_9GAMM|nr:spermidine synthase [Marinomonas pollencensis]REG85498.1 spermidine synthase [Marinomonas pollencensis]
MNHLNLLHDSADEYGPIRVFDDGKFRILSFADGDEQSRIQLSTPHVLQHEYTQAMTLSLLFSQPKRIGILGLGGGTLLNALYHAIPSVQITAVELRQEVIDAAQMYFKLPNGKRIQIENDDAQNYLVSGFAKKVDILMTDLYNTEGMERGVLQTSFLENCAKNIKENGLLVLNCWMDHKNDLELVANLKRIFVDVRAIDTGSGNWVVLAGKQKNELNGKELKASAQKISAQLGFPLSRWLSKMYSL